MRLYTVALRGSTSDAHVSLSRNDSVVVGRGDEAGLVVPDPRVSKMHATLSVESDGSLVVVDSSTNGCFMYVQCRGLASEPRLGPSSWWLTWLAAAATAFPRTRRRRWATALRLRLRWTQLAVPAGRYRSSSPRRDHMPVRGSCSLRLGAPRARAPCAHPHAAPDVTLSLYRVSGARSHRALPLSPSQSPLLMGRGDAGGDRRVSRKQVSLTKKPRVDEWHVKVVRGTQLGRGWRASGRPGYPS